MINAFGSGMAPTYKPENKWVFADHLLSGINAFMGYEGSQNFIRLPPNLSDEQRDLVLWAYEKGFKDGEFWGQNDLRVKFKRLMELDNFR